MRRLAAGASKRRFKEAVNGALASVASALANPHRMELLDLLSQRARTVQDVAAEANLSIANASQHLQILARGGLVTVERRGVFARYRTAGPTVYRLLASIREVAEANGDRLRPAVASFLGEREPGIADASEVRALLRDPRITLLDARPPEEYEAGHLPGAINAPMPAIKQGTLTFVRGRCYVVYCRGAYCVFADEVVTELRERGFHAMRLALGPPDWEGFGGQLERAS
jgi:DNA-binding transcriptional ArsR family regulator/rhodanese-related sulfurtransferase